MKIFNFLALLIFLNSDKEKRKRYELVLCILMIKITVFYYIMTDKIEKIIKHT